MKKSTFIFIIIILIIISAIPLSFSASSISALTKGYADTLYCQIDGSNCALGTGGANGTLWSVSGSFLYPNTSLTGGVDDISVGISNATTRCFGPACISSWDEVNGSATDTNESERFNNLVADDCPGTDKVVGVYDNGTVVCGEDVDTDSDTTYTAEEVFIYLDGTTFRFNLTEFNDTYDGRYLQSYTESDPLYSGDNASIIHVGNTSWITDNQNYNSSQEIWNVVDNGTFAPIDAPSFTSNATFPFDNIWVGQFIKHYLDDNTAIQFLSDRIRLSTGGTTRLDIQNNGVTFSGNVTMKNLTAVDIFANDLYLSAPGDCETVNITGDKITCSSFPAGSTDTNFSQGGTVEGSLQVQPSGVIGINVSNPVGTKYIVVEKGGEFSYYTYNGIGSNTDHDFYFRRAGVRFASLLKNPNRLDLAHNLVVNGNLNMTNGNITSVDTVCLNENCSAKIYHDGTGIVITS